MPSIVPGVEYDIFISYRHNDNLDGWVTDFVQSLEKELKATLKDQLTIYFDRNPQDGLLETHNVDKSLEGKLKCLIFIPILSQTYCDPKSFAWRNEFVAFNKIAKEDSLGRDIKLGTGNVASRILPIKIHDLDEQDKAVIETEIGGMLRAIEFIFRSPGVNRPLRETEDHPHDNLNKTFYRDQINKVANAIKEIFFTIQNPETSRPQRVMERTLTPPSSRKRVLIISTLLFVLVAFFLYQEFSSSGNSDPLDKSIAVLPFTDMSPTGDQQFLGDGIANAIINSLVHVKGLKVIGRTSSFQFKGDKIDLREVGEKLNVRMVLEGSVQRDQNNLRVTVELIDVTDNSNIWSIMKVTN